MDSEQQAQTTNKENGDPNIPNELNFSVDSLEGGTAFAQVVETKDESPLVDFSFGPALTVGSSISPTSPALITQLSAEYDSSKAFAECGDSNVSNTQTAQGDTTDPGSPLLREAEQYADDLARELINDTNQIAVSSFSNSEAKEIDTVDQATTELAKTSEPTYTSESKIASEYSAPSEETAPSEPLVTPEEEVSAELVTTAEVEATAESQTTAEVETTAELQTSAEVESTAEVVTTAEVVSTADDLVTTTQHEDEEEETSKKEELRKQESTDDTQNDDIEPDSRHASSEISYHEKPHEEQQYLAAGESDEQLEAVTTAEAIAEVDEPSESNQSAEESTAVVDTQWETANKNQEAYQTFQTAGCASLLEDSDKSAEMEFTKNYSDDLLMGQTTGAHGELPSGGADLADFELPPYSGSSSGSEPRPSSPIKKKSSVSSSSAAAAQDSTTSQQVNTTNVAPPDLTAVKNLLLTGYSRVSHIFHWTRPIESGAFFTIGAALIVALTFFSIISVVAYTALGIILASCSIRTYKALMKALNRSTETPFDHIWDKVLAINVSLSSEKIYELLDASLGNLNASLCYLKQVLLAEDKLATFKFGLVLYLLTYIGSWFNGMTLITISYLALFTVPIFYEKNKTKIDEIISVTTGQASSTLSTITNKVTSLVFSSAPPTTSGSKKQN